MSIAGVRNSARREARLRAARKARAGAYIVSTWNALHPSGTRVTLTLDDGTKVDTRTRSEAWCLGDGTPVVLLEGKTGGWLLTRVDAR